MSRENAPGVSTVSTVSTSGVPTGGASPAGADDWQERLRAAVEETLARRAARAEERRRLAAARDAGLEERHRQKLARTAARGDRGRSRGRGVDTGDGDGR